jgi:hypothetical protein
MDTSYQVSVHLAEGFQRRRLKCGLQPPSITDDTATLVHMPILNLIFKT